MMMDVSKSRPLIPEKYFKLGNYTDSNIP